MDSLGRFESIRLSGFWEKQGNGKTRKYKSTGSFDKFHSFPILLKWGKALKCFFNQVSVFLWPSTLVQDECFVIM